MCESGDLSTINLVTNQVVFVSKLNSIEKETSEKFDLYNTAFQR